MIKEIKGIKKEVVLMSLPPIDSERYFNKITHNLNSNNILNWLNGKKQVISNWHERYNLEIFKLAINNDVPVIDITSKFLEHNNYAQFLCEDGVHPNEKGHQIIAEAIEDHIKRKNIILQVDIQSILNIRENKEMKDKSKVKLEIVKIIAMRIIILLFIMWGWCWCIVKK